MRSAIKDLMQFSDSRLFEEVSEGISQIVENAVNLEDAASCLIQNEHYRNGEILSSFAEEEAAKVLVLVDVVRCPRNLSDAKSRTLGHFHDHLAKRVYAEVCSWRPADFEEVAQRVERECQEFHLEGPNDVDWVFPNSLRREREDMAYVDYVKDVTTDDGPYFWNCPLPSDLYKGTHYPPDSVEVARALYRIGATTPEGLAVVAEIWRPFVPQPETTAMELINVKERMLEHLRGEGLLHPVDSSVNEGLDRWPFPLWSMEIGILPSSLDDLRRGRTEVLRWLNETAAKREPAPAISRRKVEALDDAYTQFSQERDELIDRLFPKPKNGRFRVVPLGVYAQADDLDSCKRLKRMVLGLTDEERADLVALSWFGRPEVIDWPATYKRAHEQIRAISCEYQIGVGSNWLTGLERWERKPREFEAGQ